MFIWRWFYFELWTAIAQILWSCMWNRNCIVAICVYIYIYTCISILHNLSKNHCKMPNQPRPYKKYSKKKTLTVYTILKANTKNMLSTTTSEIIKICKVQKHKRKKKRKSYVVQNKFYKYYFSFFVNLL